MDNSPFTIPLHDMLPTHEGMNGKLVRVTGDGLERVGEIVAKEDRANKRFGIRIDLKRPVVLHERSQPIPEGKWVEIGTIKVDVLKLTKEQIGRIVKKEGAEVPFEITL